MKKIVALLLALCMIFVLASCGGGGDSSNSQTSSETSSSSAESSGSSSSEAENSEAVDTPAGEAYAVELLLPTMQTIPSAEAVQTVEDAINKHISEDLGITDFRMELKLQSLSDYESSLSMDLASGGKHDIMYTGVLNTAVTNGYLVDLTDMEEIKPAIDVLPDKWIYSGMINGRIYGVPCYKGQVLSWKYIYDTAYGDAYDMDSIDSLEDVDAAVTAMKAKYPEEHFTVFGSDLPRMTADEDHVSVVGNYAATIGDSTELVNYFETDSFRRALDLSYKWRSENNADPEGSTNTLTHDVLSQSGSAKGVIMGHAYSEETVSEMFTMNNTYGATWKAKEFMTSNMSTNTLTYGIAYTSENPSAAAKLFSLIWTDEFIASTLIYGVEGISWEWNEDHSSIVYPEGLGLDTVPYSALFTCGAFGNQFLLYGMDGNTSEEDKVYMEELIKNAWVPPLFGFIPDSNPVSTQVAAVSNVYDQYYDVLAYGDVAPDDQLPAFLSALEAAGINDIIAEYQKQADAWLETVS